MSKIGTLRNEKGRAVQAQKDMRRDNLSMRKDLKYARSLLAEVLKGSDLAIAEMRADGDSIEPEALAMVGKIRDFLSF